MLATNLILHSVNKCSLISVGKCTNNYGTKDIRIHAPYLDCVECACPAQLTQHMRMCQP